VDTTVELGQLVLQITQSNIDVDPEKILFPHCSTLQLFGCSVEILNFSY
jgi:hypothetical protein